MMCLRDLLSWCEADEAGAVRTRLRSVVGQLATSKDELAAVLGEGVLQ